MSEDAAGPRRPGNSGASPRITRALAVLRRTPFTTAFTLAMLVVGLATGTLHSPAVDKPWYRDVATGLPAFAEGRWYTLATSPFFVDHPLVFITLLPLVVGGIGWAEWKFGWLRTAGLFIGGHVIGVLGAAGLIWLLAQSGRHFPLKLAAEYDVGPSCGALTALIFAIATLPAPWRLRARIAMGVWIGVSMLYLGTLADIEHAVSMVVALAVSGWLPAFRRPTGRPTQREWRLIALSLLITIGLIEIIDIMVPYDGPLGVNDPASSILDVAIDIVVISLIANGIRHGYRAAWAVALALGVINVVTAMAARRLLPLLVKLDIIESPGALVGTIVAPGVFWLALIVLLVLARGAFRVRLRHSKRSLAAEYLSRTEFVERLKWLGGGTISWMATWEGNERISVGGSGGASGSSEPGEPGKPGAIAYQSHSGVAIMLGDPVVASGGEREALAEFARVTQHAGFVPCVFSAGAASAAARPEGWRAIIVAEDTIVDLPGLSFTGKPWGDVRTAMNRAKREGIKFRMVRLAEEPWSVLAQVRAISEQWSGDKGLPEMRFTLGTVEEALDPEAYVGIAVDAGGSLHGVTSWLPVYGSADAVTGEPHIVGWTLDLMRRRDDGFGPVMEFLIAEAAQHFAAAGYEFVSLSGAPLVRPESAEVGPVDQVLQQIGSAIEPLYGFKSLHRFKQKFSPRSEPLYLLFRDEGDLPRIGIAITRAYLPDASLRELVASAASSNA